MVYASLLGYRAGYCDFVVTGGDMERVTDLLGKKVVLVTGTTGFVGKVYLEKLLRSCPEVTVRVIARGSKKHPCARARFEVDVLQSSIFNRLRDDGVDVSGRIQVVDAQLAAPQLGLTEIDFAAVAEGVDLIVNCAASVNFREALDQALAINIESVISITALAARFNLPLVHVSTCYVHGLHRGEIKEELHQPLKGILPGVDGTYPVEALMERMQKDIAQVRAAANDADTEENLITLGARYAAEHGFNDVYTLTKWMGEALIHKTLKGHPVSIVRPAIVESTLSEPTPNWLEGVKVCDAVLFAWARRKTIVMPGDVNTSIDIIPVDLVANAMMLASADVLNRTPGVETIQVGSSHVNPILLGQFTKILQRYCLANIDRLDNLFLEPPSRFFFLLKRNNFARLMSVLSVFMRFSALLGGSKLYKNFQVTRNLALVFGFYSTSAYSFKVDNLDALAAKYAMDRECFPCDPRAIEWTSYLEGHADGVNAYAMRPRKKKSPVVAEQQGKLDGEEQVA